MCVCLFSILKLRDYIFSLAFMLHVILFHLKTLPSTPPSSFSSLQRRALCSTTFHHGDQVLQHERATLPHEESTTAAVENNTGQCVTVK